MKKPRISLRVALILIAVLCVWLGKISIDARRQKEAVEWVKKNGGIVKYDWEPRNLQRIVHVTRPGPKWLRELVGDHFFQSVEEVVLSGCGISDITPLSSLWD